MSRPFIVRGVPGGPTLGTAVKSCVVQDAVRLTDGTMDFVGPTGFGTPKAAVFWLCNALSPDTPVAQIIMSFGSTDGTDEVCHMLSRPSLALVDCDTPWDCFQGMWYSCFSAPAANWVKNTVDTQGNHYEEVNLDGTFNSWITDGVRINVTWLMREDEGTDGECPNDASKVFSEGTATTLWTFDNVTPADHELVIISGDNVTPGTYAIASVTDTTLTLATDPCDGGAVDNAVWRIDRKAPDASAYRVFCLLLGGEAFRGKVMQHAWEPDGNDVPKGDTNDVQLGFKPDAIVSYKSSAIDGAWGGWGHQGAQYFGFGHLDHAQAEYNQRMAWWQDNSEAGASVRFLAGACEATHAMASFNTKRTIDWIDEHATPDEGYETTGTLTASDEDEDGEVTAAGNGCVDDSWDRVNVVWATGWRENMEVTDVSGDVVTVTGGSGDTLPSASGTPAVTLVRRADPGSYNILKGIVDGIRLEFQRDSGHDEMNQKAANMLAMKFNGACSVLCTTHQTPTSTGLETVTCGFKPMFVMLIGTLHERYGEPRALNQDHNDGLCLGLIARGTGSLRAWKSHCIAMESNTIDKWVTGGELTTRNGDGDGIITVPTGHGITDSDTVKVEWESYSRNGMDVDAVTATTIEVSGGTGTALPSLNTEWISVAPQTAADNYDETISGLTASEQPLLVNLNDGSAGYAATLDSVTDTGFVLDYTDVLADSRKVLLLAVGEADVDWVPRKRLVNTGGLLGSLVGG